jgi:hypothetical protein
VIMADGPFFVASANNTKGMLVIDGISDHRLDLALCSGSLSGRCASDRAVWQPNLAFCW